jgi:hypothetical protein
MTPTPEQISEWTAKFEEWFDTQLTVAGIPRHIQQAFALHGYLHAKTAIKLEELQAELKQIAENIKQIESGELKP